MMYNRITKIFENPLLRNSIKLSSSNIVLYLLPLIVTPILSRIYTPDAFGGWGVFSSTIVIINVILFGGYEYVIVKARQEELKNVIRLCIAFSVCVIAFIYLLFEIGESIRLKFIVDFPDPALLYIYLFASVGLVICQNFANRTERYTMLACSFLIIGLSQAILRVLFGYLYIKNGLILGTAIAQLIALFYLFVKLNKYIPFFFTRPNFAQIKNIAVQYKNFPLYDAPASLLAFAAFNLPLIILSFYYSRSDIGCFSVIIQLLLLPMSFIGSAIGKVYYQQISVSNNDMQVINNKTLNVFKILCYISLVPAIFLLFGGNQLIVIFLGKQWHLAGQVALCLSIWSIPTILSQPLLPIYRNLNKQKKTLWYNGIYFITGIGSILVGCICNLSLTLTLCLFAGGCFIAKMLLVVDVLKITGIAIGKIPKLPIGLLITIITIWLFRVSIL